MSEVPFLKIDLKNTADAKNLTLLLLELCDSAGYDHTTTFLAVCDLLALICSMMIDQDKKGETARQLGLDKPLMVDSAKATIEIMMGYYDNPEKYKNNGKD